MSRHGTLIQAWGDDDYTFRLGYGDILKIEESCDAGIRLIAERMTTFDCRQKDVTETIRLSLIGGGMSQGDALRKVQRFVMDYQNDAVSWEENRRLAFAIIASYLIPPKDQQLKKAKGARKTKAPASPEKKQTSSDLSVSPP